MREDGSEIKPQISMVNTLPFNQAIADRTIDDRALFKQSQAVIYDDKNARKQFLVNEPLRSDISICGRTSFQAYIAQRKKIIPEACDIYNEVQILSA